MMSRATLAAAKVQAVEQLIPGVALHAFKQVLKERYGVPPHRIQFDYKDALRRINEAVYTGHIETVERAGELAGETDGDTIWVMRNLEYDHLVDTLVHEALHDSVYIVRPTRSGDKRGLSCDDEHRAIDLIIEPDY